jgi:esterase/lipase superfamily enzyme
MTQSMFVVEKKNLKTDYTQLVGVFDSRELADAAAEQSLEYNEPADWNIQITIVPLNNDLG